MNNFLNELLLEHSKKIENKIENILSRKFHEITGEELIEDNIKRIKLEISPISDERIYKIDNIPVLKIYPMEIKYNTENGSNTATMSRKFEEL